MNAPLADLGLSARVELLAGGRPAASSVLEQVSPLVAVVCGAGVGVGLLLIASWLLAARTGDGSDGLSGDLGTDLTGASPSRRRAGAGDGLGGHAVVRRVAVAVGAGVLAGAFTRWPVAAVLTGLGVWVLPRLVGVDPGAKAAVARVEAIASWTEMLRDTLAAAAGLEQAIAATVATAPEAIRPHVQDLQARIDAGERLPVALRAFADDLDDPAADLVVAALVLASEHRARQLGDLLASLATACRDQVTMRLRVAAGRARTRTSVRLIVGVTLTMAAGLVLLNRSYLTPYNTLFGQLVLAGVGVMFASALVWLDRIATIATPQRVLTGLHTLTGSAVQAGYSPRAGTSAPAVGSAPGPVVVDGRGR